MRKAKSFSLLIFFIVLLGAPGLYFVIENQKADQFVQEAKDKLLLLESSERVWSIWKKGIHSPHYNKFCDSKVIRDGRCSTEVLRCVLEKDPLKVFLKGGGRISLNGLSQLSQRINGGQAPGEGTRVVLSYGEAQLSLFLEKSCHKIFLPQRRYGFGEKRNPDIDERFDNFKRLIFIDKFMTHMGEFSIERMADQCHSRGMQLLESHMLDAASFHPVDLKNTRPQEFLRPPFPWGRGTKNEFLYKAQKNSEFKFEERFCDFVFTKECVGKENESLPSWMGLKNPLGDRVEVVRNVLIPDENIVPSSSEYPIHSKWHRLGMRANIENLDRDEVSKYKFGFRCMQEVWQ